MSKPEEKPFSFSNNTYQMHCCYRCFLSIFALWTMVPSVLPVWLLLLLLLMLLEEEEDDERFVSRSEDGRWSLMWCWSWVVVVPIRFKDSWGCRDRGWTRWIGRLTGMERRRSCWQRFSHRSRTSSTRLNTWIIIDWQRKTQPRSAFHRSTPSYRRPSFVNIHCSVSIR